MAFLIPLLISAIPSIIDLFKGATTDDEQTDNSDYSDDGSDGYGY